MAGTGQPHDGLAAALAAFQAAMPVVTKANTAEVESQRTGRRFTYTYADLADITRVAMPLLAAQGLAFVCEPVWYDADGGGARLRGCLIHTSGEERCGTLPITGETPQQLGSSITYMRRYLLGCLTGIVTDDDDDARTAQQSTARIPVPTMPDGPPPERKTNPRPRESGPFSEAQHGLYRRLLRAKGAPEDRGERLAWVSGVIGRDITSSKEMNSREMGKVIDALTEMPDAVAGE